MLLNFPYIFFQTLNNYQQTIMIRLIGTLPGPVYYGYLIEGACILSNKVCGESSSCSLLDNKELGWRLFAFSMIIKVGCHDYEFLLFY